MSSAIPDDWFEVTARANFERAFLPATNRPNLRHLQIGAFTGNASVWLLENVLTHESSCLYDVDTWDGGKCVELAGMDWGEVERVYDERTEKWQTTGQLAKCKQPSYKFFAEMEAYGCLPFDFVYVDGDHSTVGTLEDAIHAYRLLKPGGLICFDDYEWRSKMGALYEPTIAIDLVKIMYAGRLRVLRTGEQCWMQRVDAEVRH